MSELPAGSNLTMIWVDDIGDLKPLRDEWQALAERTDASIYLRPDWLGIWWEHFGAGRQLACLVARADGALVGVLPFSLDRIWLGPLPVRIATQAGTDPNCIVFDLPVLPEWLGLLLQAALTHLTGKLGCLAVSFTPLSKSARHAVILRNLCRPGTGLALQEAPAGNHVVFDLPDRFEDYLDHVSKKRRSQFRRDVKGLTSGFGMTTDNIVPDSAAFDDFVSFHGRQWQALGRGGHFVDWPGSAEFYRAVTQQVGLRSVVRLHRLKGATGPLATQFVLLSGRTAYWRLPARSIDPSAERLSAGKVGLLYMIDALISEGISRIEAGRGDYGYKLDYGGKGVEVRRAIVRRDNRLSALGLRMLMVWASVLNYVYYRLWFLKLAPRLQRLTGRRPRPLWNSWIHTRF